MPKYNLNAKAVEKGRDLIVKGRLDDGPWLPFENIDVDAIIDPDGDGEPNWDAYSEHFLGSGSGEGMERLAFPISRVVWGDQPRVSVAALRLIRIQSAHLGETNIFKAADELLGMATGNQFASMTMEQFAAAEVKVRVKKPQAPVPGRFSWVAVEINRSKK